MKSTLAVLVVLVAIGAHAATKPEPPRPEVSRRSSEVPQSLVEKAETLSRTAREVLGARAFEGDFNLVLPKNLEANKVNRYERNLEELSQLMREKEVEFAKDGNKTSEVATILTELNKVYATRSTIQEFLKNNNLSTEQAALVQKFLDLIDNFLTIELTVLTVEGLSQNQVIRSMNPISSLPLARLKIEDFMAAEAQITGILPKDYNMAKAARCVR